MVGHQDESYSSKLRVLWYHHLGKDHFGFDVKLDLSVLNPLVSFATFKNRKASDGHSIIAAFSSTIVHLKLTISNRLD